MVWGHFLCSVRTEHDDRCDHTVASATALHLFRHLKKICTSTSLHFVSLSVMAGLQFHYHREFSLIRWPVARRWRALSLVSGTYYAVDEQSSRGSG